MDLARKAGRVSVEGLVECFEVTPQTIRKNLNELCERGLLARVHGGAVLASGIANVGYEARRALAAEEKNTIGALCAAAIPNEASLFINIGTTTEAVARALLDHRNLMVVANNLNVANILAQNPSCEVIIAGGVLRRADGGLIGEATADFMRQFKLDFAVIGASALDRRGALLDYDYGEVRVAKAIIENARETFLVADSGKFSHSAPVRIAHVRQISQIFTDVTPPADFVKVCARNNVTIHQLGPDSTAHSTKIFPADDED